MFFLFFSSVTISQKLVGRYLRNLVITFLGSKAPGAYSDFGSDPQCSLGFPRGGGGGGQNCLIISPNEVFGDIMVLALPPRPPRRREHSNSKSIQRISFKFYMRVDTPLRFVAIEIWYPPMTRTTGFAAKRHSYPPNLQNAISPQVIVRLLSNFIQRWGTWSYIQKCQWLD